MQADILTIFPGFFRGPLDHGITRRACEMGLVTITVHDLREFTHDNTARWMIGHSVAAKAWC